ncbi:hypothetical protein ASG73_17305 [Janibacter sp. Soil728]|uniref:hypothetical protein n=1 Tax=Janibacter sp. Soil728 TaxID=1736393 RepID=UPI00070221DB|nr:hypothetical protein [Janibacter sp. Soil728]KRE35010.1 hypothetical protein ASG73_17305 [Janibacter sp. Soil728]
MTATTVSCFTSSYEAKKYDMEERVTALWASEEFGAEGADAELARFDLSASEVVEQVLVKAEREAAAEFGGGPFPRNAVGLGRWLYLVRNLNVLLAAKGTGWEVYEPDGICRILNAERKVAIVVQAGDEMTGRPKAAGSRYPRTRRDRGAAVLRTVSFNGAPMLPEFEAEREEELRLEDLDTWFLLVRAGEGKVAGELSLPRPVLGDSKRIEAWGQRILLGVTEVDGVAASNPSTDDFPDDGIDFPVTRR